MRMLPAELRDSIREYFKSLPGGLPIRPSRADTVLGLLRINTKASLRAAEAIVGKPITHCPAYLPPWPPKPVDKPRGSVIVKLARNPCLPTTGAFQRYRKLRVGMTLQQAHTRGVTLRDLRRWGRAGHVEVNR